MKKSPKVMFAGLGHAGIKAMLTAAGQFDSQYYSFVAIDTPNEIINLDAKCFDHAFPTEAGWENAFGNSLQGLQMLALFMGLGGKTAPDAAKLAIAAENEKNIPVVAFATLPFSFEGEQRKIAASHAVTALRQGTNATIILPNDLLFSQFPKDSNAMAAFERADEWIAEVACSVLKISHGC